MEAEGAERRKSEEKEMTSFSERVYELTKQIPPGKVATYGQIAGMISSPRAAIIVGQALHLADNKIKLPWQRVINSKGMISTTCLDHPKEQQAYLLQKEGVEVINGKIDLKKFGWKF